MNNTQYYTSGSGRIDSVIRQSSVPPSADCRVNNEHQGYSLSSYQYSCLNDLDYSISVGDKCTNQCQGKSNSKQMLDLYLPQSADPSTVPIVVFVHGGGWRRGDRRAYRHYFSKYDVNLLIAMIMATWGIYQNVGKAFARSGIACAVVSYRLSQLKFPYLILEKLTSFLMTTAIICGPILACSWFTVRYLLAVNSLALTFSDCLWVLCTTAPALFIIYCFYITIYLPSKRIVLLLPLSIIILQLINSTSPFKAYLYYKILYAIITAVTLSLIQGFSRHDDSMDHFNDQTNEVRHPVHVNDVARSIQWLIQYGQKTKLYNPQSLYLCGHSAGGHIVSLLVLDPSYLNNVGVQSSDIKAVISISGVYNLYGLSRSILKQFYLSPAFGNDPATWAMASPCNHITRTKSKHTPPFFVINPKYDFSFLHEDADKFVATLSDNEFRCKRLVTPNRNHLTVMKEFYWKEKPCSGNVEEMSILFIYECEATHK